MDKEEELIGARSSVKLLKRGYGDKAIHGEQAIPAHGEHGQKEEKHTTSLTDGR